jgi:hypothetical protein
MSPADDFAASPCLRSKRPRIGPSAIQDADLDKEPGGPPSEVAEGSASDDAEYEIA